MNFNRSPNPIVRKIGDSGNGLIRYEDIAATGDVLGAVNDTQHQVTAAAA
jgi:hypothetical protein